MNGKPNTRKKKPATVATINGVELTAEQQAQSLVQQISFKLMTFSYFVMSELITILVNGGMPQEQAQVRAAEIVKRAMEKFSDSEVGQK